MAPELSLEQESEIIRLSNIISKTTRSLTQHLKDHGLPQPSFNTLPPAPSTTPSEITTAKFTAINACMELLDHLQGPLTTMLPLYNGSSLQAISRYSIATHVPMNNSISYNDLSQKCGIHVFELKQVIRFAIVFHRLFKEEKKGFVSHSVESRILVEDEIVKAGIGQFDEFYGCFARTVDAMDQFKGHEPNETGFSLSHNTTETLFEYLRSRPTKAKQFSEAMKFYTGPIPAYSPNYLIKGYPWAEVPAGAVVVDLGGSDGHVGRLIKKENPGLRVTVQDLEGVIEEARAAAVSKTQPGCLGSEEEQVEYRAHDFFTPQPIIADIYLFRWVLHDWPDEYVIRILRQLIPALKRGAKVVVNESLCPESGSLPIAMERYIRYMDLMMLAINKSRLRDEEEWRGLFEEADERFGEIRCWVPEGSALAVIEAIWEG
ncbi:O-methyltransferase-like protein [Aspergillus crustosus]